MRAVFQQKVAEKEAKLKQSESEVSFIYFRRDFSMGIENLYTHETLNSSCTLVIKR